MTVLVLDMRAPSDREGTPAHGLRALGVVARSTAFELASSAIHVALVFPLGPSVANRPTAR
jgi:hypothetical protein